MANRATEREVKTFRVGQLIQNNPTYSYTRLNKMLVKEFGSGLRKQYVLELVRSIREVSPTQKEIKALDKEKPDASLRSIYWKWRRAGFVAEEARELVKGHGGVKVNATAVYNSAPGVVARARRKKYIKMLAGAGFGSKQIAAELRDYYTRDAKRSPWDFIRLEYKPVEKTTVKSYEIAREKSKARIKTLYNAYHRRKK